MDPRMVSASSQQRIVAPPACRCSRRHSAATAAAAAPLRRRRAGRPLHTTAAAWEADALTASSKQPSSLAEAKAALLYVVAGTERGSDARGLQRGMVEEAQVAVETMGSSEELDFERLQGRWKLEYTTARDVLPLVAPQRLPAPLRVGRIWQQFSSLEEGRVQNVIEALPPAGLPLADGASLTLIVEAGWEPRTMRSIALTFREAGFQEVRLSPGLQNLLASPILPRGWWNQQLLLALKQLSVRVPLVSRLPGTSSNQQRPRGINYMLTYLDDDMLIGRAQGNGGSFIFTRDTEWEAEHSSQPEQQQKPHVGAAPGTRVAVLERSELRPRGAHFLIQPSGVRALEAISPEIKQAVARHHLDHQCTRRFSHTGELLHSSDSGSLTAAISQRGELVSLPWHVLQRELADALPPGVLHTSHRFLRFTQSEDGVQAEFETADGSTLRIEAGLLIGCDGSQSPVREQLLGDGPPTYLGTAIWRAVRPIPQDWPVEHGWCSWSAPPSSGKAVVMAATLRDGQVAWQAFQPWPVEQLAVIGGGRRAYVQDRGAGAAEAGATAGTEQQAAGGNGSGSSDWRAAGEERLRRAAASVEGYPAVVVGLIMGTDPSAIVEHGQFCREPEQCQEYARGRVALVGDAAHLATAMLGMGCSLALEDACELGRAIGEHGITPAALQAYQAVRVPAASEVQAASVQLYKDLRAGQLKGPLNEFQFCIDRGFADRTFAPLAPAAAAGAAMPAVLSAAAAQPAAQAVEVQAS